MRRGNFVADQYRRFRIVDFTLRIFDGETSGASGYWDINTGDPNARLIFRLFPDVDPFDGEPDDVAPLVIINEFAEEIDEIGMNPVKGF